MKIAILVAIVIDKNDHKNDKGGHSMLGHNTCVPPQSKKSNPSASPQDSEGRLPPCPAQRLRPSEASARKKELNHIQPRIPILLSARKGVSTDKKENVFEY